MGIRRPLDSLKGSIGVLLPGAIGLTLVLIALFDPRDDAFPVGRGAVALIGGMVAMVSVWTVVRAVERATGTSTASPFLGGILTTAFVGLGFFAGGPFVYGAAITGLLAIAAWVHFGRKVVGGLRSGEVGRRDLALLGGVLALVALFTWSVFTALQERGSG